jgi:hypothetical protein
MPILADSTPGPHHGLFTETAYLKADGASTEFDRYGNPIPGEPSRTPTPAWWEPRTSGEQTAAQEQVTSGYWLYLPAGTDLSAYDAVELDGLDYEVGGEPGRQPGGFVLGGYVKTAVTRVDG